MTSDIKLYYVITGWKKTYVFFLFKRSFITDHSLLKGYKSLPEKWFGKKYDIFKIFKTGNFVNIYISFKTQFQQYGHFQQYQNCINLKETFQSKQKIEKKLHIWKYTMCFPVQNISDWKTFRS